MGDLHSTVAESVVVFSMPPLCPCSLSSVALDYVPSHVLFLRMNEQLIYRR